MNTIILTPVIERIIQEYKRVRDEANTFIKLKEHAYSEIIRGYFDTYGQIQTDSGVIVAKYEPIKRINFQTKKLEQERPDIYSEYLSISEYGKFTVL